MKVINFEKELKKRNKQIKLQNLTKEETPKTLLYEGDFIYNEDRVNIIIDSDSNQVSLNLYDIKTGLPYANLEVDSFTLFLISNAFLNLYVALENEYSIH